MVERQELPSSVRYGPLGSVGTIYELPNGRRRVVTFANRGSDVLIPIRNDRGELWIGHLLRDDAEPAHFDDWERGVGACGTSATARRAEVTAWSRVPTHRVSPAPGRSPHLARLTGWR